MGRFQPLRLVEHRAEMGLSSFILLRCCGSQACSCFLKTCDGKSLAEHDRGSKAARLLQLRFFSVLSGVRLVPQSGHFWFFLGISAPVEADVVMPRV